MNTKSISKKPYGLFCYLYNHYQVRYPDYHMFIEPILAGDELDAVEQIDPEKLSSYLTSSSWLLGIARPDLAEVVHKHWSRMTPLARGNYLAGFTERTYFGSSDSELARSFISEQLNQMDLVEFTGETACEIGCCLLAMEMDEEFRVLLRTPVVWEQEIERYSESDAKRWKTLKNLSCRIIDVFLEAAIVMNRTEVMKLLLKHGADPNIHVWQLERSWNALYPLLGYAITHNSSEAVDALLKFGANPKGSDLAKSHSPLALAFQKADFELIRRLLAAGANFDDGLHYEEAPLFYAMAAPTDWVGEHLTELLELLPIEAKPIFHIPHAQGGFYFTLLECVWNDPEQIRFAKEIGMDLRLTVDETALLIHREEYETFYSLIGGLGEAVRDEALRRIRREWPNFHSRA